MQLFYYFLEHLLGSIKKKIILSILNLSLVFLMLLLTKFDIKAMLFYTAVYTVLRPPNEQRKKIIITIVITLVIYFIYWR